METRKEARNPQQVFPVIEQPERFPFTGIQQTFQTQRGIANIMRNNLCRHV